MLRAIWTSKSGMNAQQNKLDAISNNLANSETTAYKSVDVGFKDLLQESLDRKGYPIKDKNSTFGIGSRTTDWLRDNKQGPLQETNIASNMALDGEGYFRVITSDGSYAYTRDGSFTIDSAGNIVDTFGNRLDIEFANGIDRNNCNLTQNNLSINKYGEIFKRVGDETTYVGKINVYTALGTDSFKSIGSNLYLPGNDVQVMLSPDTRIYQGFVEASNVDMATELTDMIASQRAYQMTSKALTTADDMWGMINNLR